MLAMQAPSEPILKARLRANPSHPRALPFLLEAIALWQGCPVRAALYADDSPAGCGTRFYPDLSVDPGDTPLYTLDWVPVARRRARLVVTPHALAPYDKLGRKPGGDHE